MSLAVRSYAVNLRPSTCFRGCLSSSLVLSIAHFVLLVKGFLVIIQKFLREVIQSFGLSSRHLSAWRLASPLDILIVTQLGRFVKREFFADFSRSFFTRCTLITLLGAPCGGFPLDTLIISQLGRFVKGLMTETCTKRFCGSFPISALR